ncbi:MAG: recombination mediator RecR [Sphingomonadales bacterium]|jgi:recombination protein RecR
MTSHTHEIDRLIQVLSKLPGLGPRSARRAVLAMIKKRESLMVPMATALMDVAEKILICEVCGNLDTISPCTICGNEKRDQKTICVVEEVSDLWALDRAHGYKGLYHILGGTLSALDGIRPEDLNIGTLISRIKSDGIREIILATNATVDGQTTAHYITDLLKNTGVEVTAIAHGVPVGGELDYLDDGTINAAIRARKPF